MTTFTLDWLGRAFRGRVGLPATAVGDSTTAATRGAPPVKINLALQGGGAHGAFTWGVLDALAADPSIQIEGISGSSAGAMNAVVFADGWLKGGPAQARRGLADFWNAVSSQLPWGAITQGAGEQIELAPAGRWAASWASHFSPSQFNPLDLNPLRDLLSRQVDFERLRAACPFKLFVGATSVRTGRLRLFREHELTAETLLASSCLPKLHHAVEIDGEKYWDGGYSANPAVFPLFYECGSRDILLVLLAPLERDDEPNTTEEIETRITELAFSATLMREMRMFVRAASYAGSSLFSTGRLERRLRNVRFHMIDSSRVGSLRRTRSQLIAHKPFLQLLHDQGRECGSDWLTRHAGGVGKRSTFDIAAGFA